MAASFNVASYQSMLASMKGQQQGVRQPSALEAFAASSRALALPAVHSYNLFSPKTGIRRRVYLPLASKQEVTEWLKKSNSAYTVL